jgi:hypothetical protein
VGPTFFWQKGTEICIQKLQPFENTIIFLYFTPFITKSIA